MSNDVVLALPPRDWFDADGLAVLLPWLERQRRKLPARLVDVTPNGPAVFPPGYTGCALHRVCTRPDYDDPLYDIWHEDRYGPDDQLAF